MLSDCKGKIVQLLKYLLRVDLYRFIRCEPSLDANPTYMIGLAMKKHIEC